MRRHSAGLLRSILLTAIAVVGIADGPRVDAHAADRRPACRDRKDNDRDGKIDYPSDPGCRSRNDRKERNPVATPTPPADSDNRFAGIALGKNASLGGVRPFPDSDPWNQDISSAPVDPNSDTLINSIGRTTGLHPDFGTVWEGAPIGIPYIVVEGTQAKTSVTFDYSDESDAGPYPIPRNPPIEGGSSSDGDRHIIIIDRDYHTLYELYAAYPLGGGKWRAGSGAIFDLITNTVRPAGWTSADAAGLPIFPGLVRYDEVIEQGEINHALRFTAQRTRRAYVAPASHFASSYTSSSLPPMGMRVRLKASFDISGYPASVQVILRALKKYGMILADNGSNWYVSGAPDERWNDDDLSSLSDITGADLEVIEMADVVTE